MQCIMVFIWWYWFFSYKHLFLEQSINKKKKWVVRSERFFKLCIQKHFFLINEHLFSEINIITTIWFIIRNCRQMFAEVTLAVYLVHTYFSAILIQHVSIISYGKNIERWWHNYEAKSIASYLFLVSKKISILILFLFV